MPSGWPIGISTASISPISPRDFFADSLVVPAAKGRWKAIGRFEDGTIAVVFFVLGSEGLSVISMRPASRKERTMMP